MIHLALDDYNREYFEAVIRGSRLLHADNVLEIYSIENRRAATFWFDQTKWCVKENPWFEEYLAEGPLVLLRSFKRARDYLLAPANGEFRNSRNRGVSLPCFVAEHPTAQLPLRRLGVFWHGREVEGDWSKNIYFAGLKSIEARK